jgi:hypothetical protein
MTGAGETEYVSESRVLLSLASGMKVEASVLDSPFQNSVSTLDFATCTRSSSFSVVSCVFSVTSCAFSVRNYLTRPPDWVRRFSKVSKFFLPFDSLSLRFLYFSFSSSWLSSAIRTSFFLDFYRMSFFFDFYRTSFFDFCCSSSLSL